MTSWPASGPASDIRLPPDLRPSDGRFGCGPSKVRQEWVDNLALEATSFLGTSHRQRAVRSMVGRLRHGLTELLALPDGYEVALGNGGAAYFWDVATFWLIERRSQHLSFGAFSQSFAVAAQAAPHLEAPDVIESPPGTHPDPDPAPGIDLYALTHNETSTGVSMEVRRPEGVDPGALVAVDATSAAGGLRVDPAQFDAYYFSPQKCFGADGGLWVAALSPLAVERAERLAGDGRWSPRSLSLPLALRNSRQDQTYNTPALATLHLFVQQLDWMLANGGLEWAASRCDQSAAIVYRWAEESDFAHPFVSDPAQRSHAVATVELDEGVDGKQVASVLRANRVVDTEPYRGMGRNQLRIALFPTVEPDDVATLTRAIDFVVAALSV